MDNELSGTIEVDLPAIKNAVEKQIPIVIKTFSLPRTTEFYIRDVMTAFLKECGQEFLFQYLDYCLNELLANAKKANTKRVYFKEQNLDIENIDDYERGMKSFKDDTLANLHHYLELQEKEGLYIKLAMQYKDDVLTVDIRNNTLLTEIEKQRIQQRLDNIHPYTMEELLGDAVDQTEGAGLGINSVGLMMQKMGFPVENFSIFVEGNETISRIVCPCDCGVEEI